MLQRDWLKLSEDARRRAFTLAGVAQLSLIQEVLDALEAAVSQGETLEDFKARIGAKLAREWGQANASRVETIFRNATQHAYNAGRYAAATHPDVIDARPFWGFDAVLDNRTSDVCRHADGTVLPASSPWWATHYPPLHHRCRSSVRTLTEAQAAELGVTKDPTDLGADRGFGALPDVEPWQPDPADFSPDLFDVFKAVAKPPIDDGKTMRAKLAQLDKDTADKLAKAKAAEKLARDAVFDHSDARPPGGGGEWAKRRKELSDLWDKALADVEAAQAAQADRLKDAFELMAAPEPGAYSVSTRSTLPASVKDKWRDGVEWVNRIVGKLADAPDAGHAVPFYGTTAARSFCYARDLPPSTKVKTGVSMHRDAPTKTVVHELGHWLEGESPALHAAALKFYDRRTAGESLTRMGAGYRATELTRRDKFLSPYMGKEYAYRGGPKAGQRYATELVSMGLELMYKDPYWLATADPDFFDFIWHAIRGLDYD